MAPCSHFMEREAVEKAASVASVSVRLSFYDYGLVAL